MPTKSRTTSSTAKPGVRTIASTSLGSSYQLTRTRSGIFLKRTDRRQVHGRDQFLITSLLFSDGQAFQKYCQADPLTSSDPFAADLLCRAFHELYTARFE